MQIFILPLPSKTKHPSILKDSKDLVGTRTAAGITQQAQADRIGTTPRAISSWENGDFQLPLISYFALARAYHDHLTMEPKPQKLKGKVEPRIVTPLFETMRHKLEAEFNVENAVLGMRILSAGSNDNLFFTADNTTVKMPFANPDLPIQLVNSLPTAVSLDLKELSTLGFCNPFWNTPFDTWFSNISIRNLLMFSPATASVGRGLLYILLVNKRDGIFTENDAVRANQLMVDFMDKKEINPILQFIAAVNAHAFQA
ncbi:hypothetical protein A2526_00200 [candidate division WOR-1 bacterium RIFOXYD2_FULL_36_8]|uniref:HTH cro/C1-type domain-containing protein n=1 Tax=candidate division WOR-1 bacterium RIFOXYB2_FULL_36_35 TaxID=1802578 RepID=A0A1F4S481_UNCSA|nr:MAG: hypothetical protein A2230_00900 [candidate division WOR-1 bacterium RIFOXYA2_FULL_36_21]OGC14240.1 MAG: hypothetical protein A2282_06615 [candidate division WOR-1 bacterium RIFOXYA12_FULL_36_13]OGC15245.1 MAG: hypothetical protein A2290_03110 [candidate division WOR-1 bacterium RIFOXYB2_FULL_36_35]OGC38256.1 MAG: hypothetical protein A2526_00200 [candidate division WOR-1 bacterium RIFOXYD2_FULL_36_8]